MLAAQQLRAGIGVIERHLPEPEAHAQGHRPGGEVATSARRDPQPGHHEQLSGGIREPDLDAAAYPTGRAPHGGVVGSEEQMEPLVAQTERSQLRPGTHGARERRPEPSHIHVAAQMGIRTQPWLAAYGGTSEYPWMARPLSKKLE